MRESELNRVPFLARSGTGWPVKPLNVLGRRGVAKKKETERSYNSSCR